MLGCLINLRGGAEAPGLLGEPLIDTSGVELGREAESTGSETGTWTGPRVSGARLDPSTSLWSSSVVQLKGDMALELPGESDTEPTSCWKRTASEEEDKEHLENEDSQLIKRTRHVTHHILDQSNGSGEPAGSRLRHADTRTVAPVEAQVDAPWVVDCWFRVKGFCWWQKSIWFPWRCQALSDGDNTDGLGQFFTDCRQRTDRKEEQNKTKERRYRIKA